MSDVLDDELQLWAREWRAGADERPDLAAELRRRVRCRSRGLVAVAACELVLCASAVWVLAGLALRPSHPADAPMALGLLGVVALTAGFAWWNRRGLWRSQAATVRDCLELSLRRVRRRQRGLAGGWLILALELLVLLPWLLARSATGPWPLGLLGTVAGVAAASLALLQSHARRELTELESLRAALAED